MTAEVGSWMMSRKRQAPENVGRDFTSCVALNFIECKSKQDPIAHIAPL